MGHHILPKYVSSQSIEVLDHLVCLGSIISIDSDTELDVTRLSNSTFLLFYQKLGSADTSTLSVSAPKFSGNSISHNPAQPSPAFILHW